MKWTKFTECFPDPEIKQIVVLGECAPYSDNNQIFTAYVNHENCEYRSSIKISIYDRSTSFILKIDHSDLTDSMFNYRWITLTDFLKQEEVKNEVD